MSSVWRDLLFGTSRQPAGCDVRLHAGASPMTTQRCRLVSRGLREPLAAVISREQRRISPMISTVEGLRRFGIACRWLSSGRCTEPETGRPAIRRGLNRLNNEHGTNCARCNSSRACSPAARFLKLVVFLWRSTGDPIRTANLNFVCIKFPPPVVVALRLLFSFPPPVHCKSFRRNILRKSEDSTGPRSALVI